MKNSKILPQIKKINALIAANIVLILAALLLINFSDIDLAIQKSLFDFDSQAWLVDKDELVAKFIFYKFPKVLFGVGVVGCLVATIIGFKSSNQKFFIQNRHRFFLIFLGLSLIPLTAANIKKFTNVYCPNQIELFAGTKPYVKIFDSYPADFHQIKKGKCFPAGHAVTGFALMILFFAFAKKSHRLWGLASGLALGWIMGFYQIAKGAHFFGDTLVSMLVCFLFAALIYKIYFQLTNSKK
ncbi:MAG: phosphatase PAP2 family protein [Rickettsiales bacterium]|nr:phosphatase PAP2 family protein [Rickettsiales bacterium]